MKILLVDADESFAAVTTYALRRHGHQPVIAVNEEEAWRRWSREQPDLILLDPAASAEGALQLVRRIREVSSVPIMVVSQHNHDADFVRAFESGVDDYVMKPFSIRQLLVRMEALMRRARRAAELGQQATASTVTCGDLMIDAAAFEVYKNGQRVQLTRLELRILYYLALNVRRVVETERLADYSWQSPGAGDARLLKTHICHIRRKLAIAGGEPWEICAFRRTGYVLTDAPRAPAPRGAAEGTGRAPGGSAGPTSDPTLTGAEAPAAVPGAYEDDEEPCPRSIPTMSRVCVIGAGYVGLVTAICLADLGHDVTCLDIDAEKIASLRAGIVPFHEPELPALLERTALRGQVRFTTDYAEAVPGREFVFIAVNTPSGAGGQADLMAIRSAARALAPLLTPNTIIVNKSTVPIGTGDLVYWLVAHATDVPFSVVSNPEFLREGSAVADFRNPDRLVFGSRDREAATKVAALYGEPGCPVLVTDIRTAEMIKYASNAFLATRISFINEVAAICERLGADVKDVAHGMGLDRRIGRHFLDAGIGWGGSCFPKDVLALIHMAAASGSHPQLLRAVVEINRDQRLAVVQKLRQFLGALEGCTIALLGLSFKPDTDDLRNAPSLELIDLLQSEGCAIRAYDPVAGERAREVARGITLSTSAYEAATEADAAVLVTEWDEFRRLDLERLRSLMRTPVFVDGRNLFDPDEMRTAGFQYAGVGRGAAADDSVYGRLGRSETTAWGLPTDARRAMGVG